MIIQCIKGVSKGIGFHVNNAKMNLNELDTTELIQAYSGIIKQLKKRGVIRTKNLLGDLGEYLVIDHRDGQHFLVHPQQPATHYPNHPPNRS